MLIHANNAGMILHIYFSITYQTTNWLKVRETGTVGKRSDVKSSKAKWCLPDVASVSAPQQQPHKEGKQPRWKGWEAGKEAGWMGGSPCRVDEREKQVASTVISLIRNGWKSTLFLSTSTFWQVTEAESPLSVKSPMNCWEYKVPKPCFSGRILLLTFCWHTSHTNAANESQCSPSPTALHTCSQLNNVICCPGVFLVRHLEDETFHPGPAQ